MIDGKEKFIKRISNCFGRNTVPVDPRPLSIPHTHHYLKDVDMDELEKIFIKNAEASGTTVYQCGSGDLIKPLLRLLLLLIRDRLCWLIRIFLVNMTPLKF